MDLYVNCTRANDRGGPFLKTKGCNYYTHMYAKEAFLFEKSGTLIKNNFDRKKFD